MNKHNVVMRTDFRFPGQKEAVYRGKVRDGYSIGEGILVMVASDRISAFDQILPKGIPFKGQVLNQVAAHFLGATKDIVPNWLISVPDPMVSLGHKCTVYPVEMVIRGYLAGSAWRAYKAGKRTICGVTMPDGMKENDKFPEPIITPTTKASHGQHDEDISRDEIINQSLVSEADYEALENYTRLLFKRGTEMAEDRGLILVDTKFEFGHWGNNWGIYLIDEILTPDSSRYWYADDYAERQAAGQPQRQLSKEFVREWLMEHGFQGKEGQVVPEMSDEFIKEVSRRYIELYEVITGKTFVPAPATENVLARIERNVLSAITNGGVC